MPHTENVRPAVRPSLAKVAALIAIFAVAAAGGALGQFLGPPKTFFLISIAMVIWFAGGWFIGGWRAVMAGLAALTAALTSSEGTYTVAFMFACMAFLSLFAHVSPREPRLRSERLH